MCWVWVTVWYLIMILVVSVFAKLVFYVVFGLAWVGFGVLTAAIGLFALSCALWVG